MKWLVLLALVGLASCRTALIGGNNARDVTIYYTYQDPHGEDVDVEYEADHLNLSLLKIPSVELTRSAAPTLTAAPTPKPAVKAAAPTPAPKTTLASKPSPTPTPVQKAAVAPVIQLVSVPLTPFVQLVPVTAFAVQPSLVQLAAAPVPPPAPQPKAAALKAAAPAAAPAPRPLAAVRTSMTAMVPPSSESSNKSLEDSDEE